MTYSLCTLICNMCGHFVTRPRNWWDVRPAIEPKGTSRSEEEGTDGENGFQSFTFFHLIENTSRN